MSFAKANKAMARARREKKRVDAAAKTARDGYHPRTLASLADEAYVFLRGSSGLMSAARVGEAIFPDATHRGSAPFARIGGRVLRLLERQGRAVRVIERGWSGWRAVG